MNPVDTVLLVTALPVLAAASYLALLTALSFRSSARSRGGTRVRFDVVVPAHDEERGIGETIASLRAMDYPADRVRILVVADNCGDATEAHARAAGARVLVRTDPDHRGKGRALASAFETVLDEGVADAVVVVDADTTVSSNLLRAFATRVDAGAEAVQAEYGVRNRGDSWRTRLMAIAFSAFHTVRSRGRERLGVSCGLRGNGMCLTTGVLRRVPYRAFSIVEDVEYGIRLGESGVRVRYADEAQVLGEMATTETSSRTQRRRWEDGRRRLMTRDAPGLLLRSLASADRVRFDLALDLLLPPLSTLGVASAAGAFVAAGVVVAEGRLSAGPWLWWTSAGLLGAYVLRGWQLSNTGARGLLDLMAAPAYVLWKLTLPLRAAAPSRDEWIRTPRRGEGP